MKQEYFSDKIVVQVNLSERIFLQNWLLSVLLRFGWKNCLKTFCLEELFQNVKSYISQTWSDRDTNSIRSGTDAIYALRRRNVVHYDVRPRRWMNFTDSFNVSLQEELNLF